MGNPVHALISPLEANEWPLFKALRLAALEESPDAFSPTHAEAAARDDDYWQRAAERVATSPGTALLIARPDRGLMSAVLDAAGVGHIGAMWVAPAARGEHIGSRLLDEGIRFLVTRGARVIELSVTETNTRARALYVSRGFELTGASEPLRPGSPLNNLFMRLDLPA